MIRAANILPETGRGTIRRMVEGGSRLKPAPNRPPLSYSPILWSILGDAIRVIARRPGKA